MGMYSSRSYLGICSLSLHGRTRCFGTCDFIFKASELYRVTGTHRPWNVQSVAYHVSSLAFSCSDCERGCSVDSPQCLPPSSSLKTALKQIDLFSGTLLIMKSEKENFETMSLWNTQEIPQFVDRYPRDWATKTEVAETHHFLRVRWVEMSAPSEISFSPGLNI